MNYLLGAACETVTIAAAHPVGKLGHIGTTRSNGGQRYYSRRCKRRGAMRTIESLKRNPSAGLLGVQLLGVLLYPLMEGSPTGRTLFGAFGLVVLGAALWVIRRSPWLTWIGSLLALPILVLSVTSVIAPRPGLPVWTAALEAVFYFYATGSLIAYMWQDLEATTDELFAAGATFTLLAWAFAYAFVVCQALIPGSFGAGAAGATRTWIELLFLSVAVLSSVGLSDVLPVAPMARGIVMLESFAGVLYIALVVSRLISLSAAARKGKP
jgi:hypothetical protein